MPDAFSAVLLDADLFIFILLRTSALVFSSPLFGRRNIPSIAKIGLAVATSYLFFTIAPRGNPIEYTTLLGFALICATELLLGVAFGFITNMFFALTFIGGQMIDMQIGLGIVNVYDPQNNTQVPVIGNILNILMLIVFFSVNGHLRLFEIIYATIHRMPAGSLVFSPAIGAAALEVFARAFLLGVMVATPIVASGLVLEILFGLLIRMVPQMHMFVIGIPMKILIGLVMLGVMLPIFINFSGRIFEELFNGLDKVFGAFAA